MNVQDSGTLWAVIKQKWEGAPYVGKLKELNSAIDNHIFKGPYERAKADRDITQLIAIGTSTGGPRALDAVLQRIPGSIPCPLLIVQHMPPKFTKSLADRLNRVCEITVIEAKHNQLLENSTAYIAPGGFHVTVVQRDGHYRIVLNEDEKQNEHRPSVDVLFESLALLNRIPRYLALLTGMGRDGALGMQNAKRSGATTIAESAETCVVYGMPKSAVELGCVDYVLPLEQIGPKLVELVHQIR